MLDVGLILNLHPLRSYSAPLINKPGWLNISSFLPLLHLFPPLTHNVQVLHFLTSHLDSTDLFASNLSDQLTSPAIDLPNNVILSLFKHFHRLSII